MGSPAEPRDRPPSEATSWAAEVFQRLWPEQPRTGLILGTGLGDLSRHLEHEVEVPFEEIPGMPRCTALSHAGRLVGGRVRGRPVLVCEGRVHRYEGYSFEEMTFPVRLMAALGVRRLLLSNASGGVNPKLASGDVLVIRDHVNFMGLPVGGARPLPGGWRGARPNPYCERLAAAALAVAREHRFPAVEGTYVAMSGPNYETRAEYRFLRRIGGDVVGMSTVPEALAAAALGMRVLALSAVTNIATPDLPTQTRADDVVAAARAAEPRLRAIVLSLAGSDGDF